MSTAFFRKMLRRHRNPVSGFEGGKNAGNIVNVQDTRRRPMKKLSIVLILMLLRPAIGQVLYNPNDERFKSLYLEKAQSDYKLQKDTFDRQKILYDKGLISQQEFEQSEAGFKTAQVTYQQAILSLAFEQPHVTIDKAIKYQSKDGLIYVKLTLRNTTSGIIANGEKNVESFGDIRTDQLANIYVSLLNDNHAVVSQPYEAKIGMMKFNEPVTVDFVLLQDLDYVTVKDVYGDKSEERKILLQMDESANRVLITPDQFSQEADLGSQANYTMTLALFSSRSDIYRLSVVNLPRQISWDFVDAQNSEGRNTRLSQVKFSQDVNSRQLSLALYLPDRYDGTTFNVDQAVEFFVVAVPRNAEGQTFDDTKKYSASDLDKMHVSYARLELVPRGVGKIVVQATNYYQEIRPGDKVTMNLTVLNDGTRPLDNIRPHVDAPVNWTPVVTPDLIESLQPGKDQNVVVTLIPPSGLEVGDYEATVKTSAFSSNRRVDGENKSIRIHISSKSNVLGTVIPVMMILGIVAGAVVLGVKTGRK